MPEFDQSRSSRSVYPSSRLINPEDHANDSAAALDEPSVSEREGLPRSYQMRHDAHFVEQLDARAAGPPIRLIPIMEIERPRSFEMGDLTPLVMSILKFGVLQPILVGNRGGRYELIAGARRLTAAARAGLTEVPCLVHYVDASAAQMLREAENLHAAQAPPTASAASGELTVPSAALREMARNLATIGSCLNLLPDAEPSLRDLMARELMQAELQRAAWLLQSLKILAEDTLVARRPVRVASILDQVLQVLGPERRLSGVALSVESADEGLVAHGDEQQLRLACAGPILALLALLQKTEGSTLRVRLASRPTPAGPSGVALDVSQDGVAVPASMLTRLFDAGWVDRPGGFATAVILAGAKRVIELHGGRMDGFPGEHGGCRISSVLPLAEPR